MGNKCCVSATKRKISQFPAQNGQDINNGPSRNYSMLAAANE
jgi:hypothetical protein